jgi:hypothetical protein
MPCYRGGVSASDGLTLYAACIGSIPDSIRYIRREAGQPEPPLKQMSCREPPARVVVMSGSAHDVCKVQKQSQLLVQTPATTVVSSVPASHAAKGTDRRMAQEEIPRKSVSQGASPCS